MIAVIPFGQAELKESQDAAICSDINGDWHGYWEIFDCSGVWAELQNYSWDCWAEINDDKILLWDVDVAREDGLAEIFYARDGESLILTEGRFMDIGDEFEDWQLSLDSDSRRLTMRGTYKANADGKFSFVFQLWPDTED